jgi:uncharacterized protein YicC (UPF0701 family)
MNVKMKSLLKEKLLLKKILKENRIYFVPLNKLLEVSYEFQDEIANLFNQILSYERNFKYYEGQEYEKEIKKVLDSINKTTSSVTALISDADFAVKKTKELANRKVKENKMNIKMAPLVKEQGSEFDTLLADLKKKGINEEEIPQNIIRERLPDALKAWIGRKKYGKEKFQKMAAAGKKKASK